MRSIRFARGAVLLLGCGEPEDPAEDESGTSTSELPSPYSDGSQGPDDGAMPSMGRDDAIASGLAGLHTFVGLRPSGVVAAFEELAVFEEDCPEEQSVEDVDGYLVTYFYTEGCTTSAGLTIVGGGRLDRWTDLVDEGRTSSGASLSGEDGTFRLEKGNRWLEFSGYMDYDAGTAEGEVDGYIYLGAEMSADASTAEASPLLREGVRAQGELYVYASDGYKMLGGNGSISGPGLGNAAAMAFGEFVVAPDECGSEPGGTISVRDDAGFWHDVVFDAATVETPDDDPKWHGNACDGCGPYLAAGVADGTACVTKADLAPLLDWEVAPW